jgi:hypothetical protein
MSLRDLMLEDLARGLAMVKDGREIVPTWRIMTPEGDYMILTRFDPDKPEQRERMLTLVPLFMAWKMAFAFVLTTETWLGPERSWRSVCRGRSGLVSSGVSGACLGWCSCHRNGFGRSQLTSNISASCRLCKPPSQTRTL